MSSIFVTPLEDLWVSNGTAEGILEGCIALAHRRGIQSGDVVLFLREKLEQSGMGCSGFDVTEPPFDIPSNRILLGALIAEFAVAIATGTAEDLVDIPWARLEPWYHFGWVSWLERLHDGIRVSLAELGPPIFRVELDPHSRSIVEMHLLLSQIGDLAGPRRRSAAEAKIDAELQLRRQVLSLLDSLPPERRPPFSEEFRAETLALIQQWERDR